MLPFIYLDVWMRSEFCRQSPPGSTIFIDIIFLAFEEALQYQLFEFNSPLRRRHAACAARETSPRLSSQSPNYLISSSYSLFANMGLISKDDRVKGLFNASSAESLHIPSESPSEDEQAAPPAPAVYHHHHHPAGPKPRVRPIPTAFFHLRKCLGKKKSRRYQDVNALMTLVEEDEFGEVTISDLAPCHDSHFAHLLSDSASMALWNEFAESSEEVQQRILMHPDAKGHVKRKHGPNGEVLSGEDAFQTIEISLRTVLRKSKVPLGLVSYMEDTLVSFFLENPEANFVSDNLSSFERLLLHAIAQYHQLLSRSFDAEDSSQGRYVKVVNPHQDFRVPALMLGDYLGIRKDVPHST